MLILVIDGDQSPAESAWSWAAGNFAGPVNQVSNFGSESGTPRMNLDSDFL
jgi:hypothetical protein